jgi:hypothetical protein
MIPLWQRWGYCQKGLSLTERQEGVALIVAIPFYLAAEEMHNNNDGNDGDCRMEGEYSERRGELLPSGSNGNDDTDKGSGGESGCVPGKRSPKEEEDSKASSRIYCGGPQQRDDIVMAEMGVLSEGVIPNQGDCKNAFCHGILPPEETTLFALPLGIPTLNHTNTGFY